MTVRLLFQLSRATAAAVITVALLAAAPHRAHAHSPIEGFVVANGIRIQFLDWGGSGPALILLHGIADNPHVFDDLAPAFADRFHVIAYARRGSGSSEARGPYDSFTLTEDLRGLMDALGIARADLVGHSAGGDEITWMAVKYPDRVHSIVYLDSGYDWADPDFHVAYNALPVQGPARPASAMASLDAYLTFQKAMWYPGLDDIRRLEGNIRASVVVRQDGSLEARVPETVVQALYAALWTNAPRDYTRIRCPALAIYPEHLYDTSGSDIRRRAGFLSYESPYWKPFQVKSIERIGCELVGVHIEQVPGAHGSFFLTDRRRVVGLMKHFLQRSDVEPASGQLRARPRDDARAFREFSCAKRSGF
jgi:pimeloyl-ACP methyl ester carboxylesterase